MAPRISYDFGFLSVFIIFVICQKVNCYPPRWSPFSYFSENETGSFDRAQSSSIPITSSNPKKLNHQQSSVSENTLSRDNIGDRIVFPDEIESIESKTTNKVSKCRGETFCEDVPDYPMDLAERALRLNPNLKDHQIRDKIDNSAPNQRTSFDVTSCEFEEVVVEPKMALDWNSTWLYLLNTDTFKQSIRVELCIDRGSSCKYLKPDEGFSATCKQKYIRRELIAILEDGTVVPRTFQIPTGCCCDVQYTVNPLERIFLNSKETDIRTPINL